MALNVQYEFAYLHKPIIPVRLINPPASISTEALVDTGADLSLFDAELVGALRIVPSDWSPLKVIGVGGRMRRILGIELGVSVFGVPEEQDRVETLWVGFVPGLAKTVGNLLGRNFLHYFDFGLHHHGLPPGRRLYLGRP